MKVFLIAVGGTGIKCLESFLYINAISDCGMGSSTEYEVLIIDSDNTGNYTNLNTSLNGYNFMREIMQIDDKTKKKLNIKQNIDVFKNKFTGYDKWTILDNTNQTLLSLCGDDSSVSEDAEDKDLVKCFFEKKQAIMDFKEGFHGCPNVGTLVTDYYINQGDNEWTRFREMIIRTTEKSHVVVMGSVFGGTGASCIPSIVKDMKEYTDTKDNNIFKTHDVHALMMLPYFSLPSTSSNDNMNYGISDIDLNTAYALEYYGKWENAYLEEVSFVLVGQPEKDCIREHQYYEGGSNQKNKSMIVELTASFMIINSIKANEKGEEKTRISYAVLNNGSKDEEYEINFDCIPISDDFVEELVIFRLLADSFNNSLSSILLKSDEENNKHYWFKQRLTEIDGKEIELVESFFKNFISWSKNINFIDEKSVEEGNKRFEEMLFAKKETVDDEYGYKLHSKKSIERDFNFDDFVMKINQYIKKNSKSILYLKTIGAVKEILGKTNTVGATINLVTALVNLYSAIVESKGSK